MFCWTEELATGNAKIDTQHQELFKCADDIFSANNNQDLEKIKKALDFLVTYVSEHFGHEESVMIRHHYENFLEHREKHTYFVTQIYSCYQKIYQNGIDQSAMDSLKVMMIEWLVDHINEEDKKLTRVLQEQKDLSCS